MQQYSEWNISHKSWLILWTFPFLFPKNHAGKCLTSLASSASLPGISHLVDYFNFSWFCEVQASVDSAVETAVSVSGRTRGYTGFQKETLWNVGLTNSEHIHVQQWPELRPRADSERTNICYCAQQRLRRADTIIVKSGNVVCLTLAFPFSVSHPRLQQVHVAAHFLACNPAFIALSCNMRHIRSRHSDTSECMHSGSVCQWLGIWEFV